MGMLPVQRNPVGLGLKRLNMKILLSICAAVVVTLVATYVLVSSQKATQFARDRQLLQSSWDAERAELEVGPQSGAPTPPRSHGAVASGPAGSEIARARAFGKT